MALLERDRGSDLFPDGVDILLTRPNAVPAAPEPALVIEGVRLTMQTEVRQVDRKTGEPSVADDAIDQVRFIITTDWKDVNHGQ